MPVDNTGGPCNNNVNQGHIITNCYLNTESPCGVDQLGTTMQMINRATLPGVKSNHKDNLQGTTCDTDKLDNTGQDGHDTTPVTDRSDRRSKDEKKKTTKPVKMGKRNRPNKNKEINRTVELKLLAVNCRSLANKTASVREIFEQEKIDVAVLSEVNIKKEAPRVKGYRVFSNLSTKRFHGVCVYVHNSLGPHTLRTPRELRKV